MTILQLDPPLDVIGPDGPSLAYFIRDYSPEADDYWTVVPTHGPKAGQFWTYSNSLIRMGDNVTLGRVVKDDEK